MVERSPSAEGATFSWVLVTPDSKGYRPSKVDRRAIRRQAMKGVGDRWRRNGAHGRSNVGQYPVLSNDDNAAPLDAADQRDNRPASVIKRISNYSGTRTFGRYTSNTSSNLTPMPLSMPLSETERQRAMFSHDLLTLSTLTVTHVGPAVSIYLERPNSLISLLHHQKRSYLSHIPGRLGHNLCLDYAASVVLLKARGILGLSNSAHRMVMLVQHGRALRMLRELLNDPVRCTEPDVLCITILLGLTEALDLSDERAWAQHISGASHLLQRRGPKQFQSDYEVDLFISLIGPIVCEAIRKNENCFLEQKEWQDALDSIIIPGNKEILERTSISISLRKSVTRLPRLFKDVSSAVCHCNTTSDRSVQRLIAQIHTLHQEFMGHLIKLRDLSFRPESNLSRSAHEDAFYELLGTNLLALLMTCRLLSAVGDARVDELEHDAILYATEIKTLEDEMIARHGWACFYLYQKATLAASVPATTDIWEATKGRIIETWRYKSWCKAMQRYTCCN